MYYCAAAHIINETRLIYLFTYISNQNWDQDCQNSDTVDDHGSRPEECTYDQVLPSTSMQASFTQQVILDILK